MTRDYRIDTIKGLLIILVIMGHIIIELDNANIINHGVMGLIYIFHMPLFILISGYLTKHPSQQEPLQMWKGVGNILVTLVIFHLLSACCTYLRYGIFLEPLKMFPFGALWYLLSLACWRIMLYYTPKRLLGQPLLYLGMGIVISLLSGLTNLLSSCPSLQRTLNFYFFFLLGFYYRQGDFNTPLWHNNKLHAGIAVVTLPLLLWLFPRCGNVMNGADYYGLDGMPEKAMVLICSIAVTLLVFNLTRDNRWLRHIGKDSLFYYVYHILVLALIVTPLVKYFQWPSSFPFIALYTALAVLILLLMSKIKLFWWVMHPTFKKKEK